MLDYDTYKDYPKTKVEYYKIGRVSYYTAN